MAKRTCEIESCTLTHHAHGYCAKHARRLRDHGDPFAVVGRRVLGSPEDRFWAYADIRGEKDCWEWRGEKTKAGYGRISNKTLRVYAHRWSYEHYIGPIPKGLEIDHLCRVRHCVNPRHLEAVTHRVNILRGSAPCALRRGAPHCIRGHEFSTENTATRSDGTRYCRECRRYLERLRRRGA